MPTGRVLLADDDVDFQEAVRLALEAHGYEVISAHSAAEAIALAAGHPLDAAVLDMMMEEPDAGAMAARHLRRQPGLAHLPIILLTSVAERTGFRVSLETPEDREWLGADAWMDKPVSPGDLVNRIEELRRARRAQDTEQ
jgi:CheY-like chemotaxis protein